MAPWLTAAEIAARAAPGLPGSERGVQLRAQDTSWPRRRRQGRGGGWEYHAASIPELSGVLVTGGGEVDGSARQQRPANDVVETVDRSARVATELAAWQRSAMEARLVLLAEIDRRVIETGCRRTAARAALVEEIDDGRAPIALQEAARRANARAGKHRAVSVRSLERWERDRAAGNVAVAPLAPAADAAPDWLEPLLRLYRQPQKPSLAQCVEMLPVAVRPSYAQAARAFRDLGIVTKSRGRMGPRALLALQVYVTRSTEGMEPAQVYTADGHTADFEVAHPKHGQPFRPEITTVVDVATRRVVGWSVALAESRWAVADALRQAIGTAVPAILYTDGGTGYVNKHFGDEAVGVLARAGVTPKRSLPYRSQARGLIERLNQSLWVRSGRQWRTFVGADMDQEARSRVFKATRNAVREGGPTPLPPWQRFMEWAAAQVAMYNARPHSALGCSPDEAWQRAMAGGWEPVRLADGEMEDLFRPYELRTVKRGAVSILGHRYLSRDLEEHGGRTVAVGYDIHDPSRVWVRAEPNGALLAVAELDAFTTPYFPASAIEQAEARRATEALKRLDDKRDRVIAERDGGPPLAIVREERTAADLALMAELEAELSGALPAQAGGASLSAEALPASGELAIPSADASDEARHAAWQAVDAAVAEGREVPERVARWHRDYRESPAFYDRAHRFGGAALMDLIETSTARRRAG